MTSNSSKFIKSNHESVIHLPFVPQAIRDHYSTTYLGDVHTQITLGDNINQTGNLSSGVSGVTGSSNQLLGLNRHGHDFMIELSKEHLISQALRKYGRDFKHAIIIAFSYHVNRMHSPEDTYYGYEMMSCGCVIKLDQNTPHPTLSYHRSAQRMHVHAHLFRHSPLTTQQAERAVNFDINDLKQNLFHHNIYKDHTSKQAVQMDFDDLKRNLLPSPDELKTPVEKHDEAVKHIAAKTFKPHHDDDRNSFTTRGYNPEFGSFKK